MLEPGKYNQLEVLRLSPSGAHLAAETEEVLLPKQYVPAGLKPGDAVRVFVYRNADDRLIATTLTPRAQAGEFAVLQVKDTGRFGAFLEVGLEKELFVPFSEQTVSMKKGEGYVVRLYLDKSGRLAASAKIGQFLETGEIPLKFGEEVDLTIYDFTDLGAKVIINDRYAGLLFKNELYDKPALGARLKGYVIKIRDDKKIDVTLRKSGDHAMDRSKEMILNTLTSSGGLLPLGDKSPAELIGDLLKMSKKSFKKAIGSLYKEGIIELTEDGIKLRKS
jgi:uncharacterized protein